MGRTLLSKLSKAVLFLLLSGFVVFLALPHIVNTLLLPALLEKTPFSDSQAAISTITTSSASGSIELKHRDRVLASIPKYTISYSPLSLFNAEVRTLTIEHGIFHLYRNGDTLELTGVEETAEGSQPAHLPTGLPFVVARVILKQCRLVLHEPDNSKISTSINGEITPSFRSSKRGSLEAIRASLLLSGDISAEVSAAVVLDDQQIDIESSLTDVRLPVLKRLLSGQLQGVEFGSLSADLLVTSDDPSFSSLTYQLDGSLGDFSYAAGDVLISSGGKADRLGFKLSGDRNNHIYEVFSLALESPIKARLAISGEAFMGSQERRTSGLLETMVLAENQPASTRPPSVMGFNAAWTPSGGLIMEGEGSIRPEETLLLSEQLTNNAAIIELGELNVSTQLKSHDDMLEAKLSMRSNPLRLKYAAAEILAGQLLVEGAVTRLQDKISGRIDGSLTHLTLPEKKVAIDGLQFSLPVSPFADIAPESDTSQKGKITIERVSYNGAPVASLSTDIALSGTTYRIDGSLKSAVIPDGVVLFNGTALPFNHSAALSWKLASSALDAEPFKAYRIMAPDIDFEAQVEAAGDLRLNGSQLSGSAYTSISDGSVQLSDNAIKLEGIDCAIEFPELPRLISLPSQRCTIGRADVSSLTFSDAEFTFRLQEPAALFIEKSSLAWCGGTLDSGSLRLVKGDPEIDTVFFGSQINLGQLLEQIGFKISEGEGSLNGKLPVKIDRETIEFDGGFLFSTPGMGGIVRFTDTDLLRQGIGGVSEAGSIGYALQALEDFSYNWTKLSFNTSGDELLLALELDGKPRTALPFKLNNNGMIVESTEGAGLQYPIRLDVNVRFPLGELLRVGQSFNSIMENSQ